MSKVLTIQILGWNSSSQLPRCLPSLRSIPRESVQLRYIDNGSADDSVAVAQRALPDSAIIRLTTNQGYSGGHNIGIAQTTTPYILILNPDVELMWPGIQRLLHVMEGNRKIGALQGKLLREKISPAIIDSTGIVLSRALNGCERGAGEIDQGHYNNVTSLIATTGACSLYRLSALEQIKHSSTEFFDADFFAYKEDVDLGWRLNRAGWSVRYEPVTVGYHQRHLKREGRTGWRIAPRALYQRLKSRRSYYSFRNWVWLIAKNATGLQILWHSPFILGRIAFFTLLSLCYLPFLRVWLAILPKLLIMRHKHSLVANNTASQ